ncbi:uncharacterized protein P884DRAFT_260049 [Thermothelomyces heterothallicus CBS 202.75]|uniref:uncharacterized protein n=1 Tax=Thermothelomyces heterothallicus CBS 202.75 TaxID=1149848 RepID=UPI0037433404
MAPSRPTDPEPAMDVIAFIVLGLQIAAETTMFLAFGPVVLFAIFTTALASIGLAVWVFYVYAEVLVTTIYEWLHDWIYPNKYKMYDEQVLAEYARELRDPQTSASTESSISNGSTPSTPSSSLRSFPPVSRYLSPGDVGPRRRRSTTVATAPYLDEWVDSRVDVLETGSYPRRFSGISGPPPSWLNRRCREGPIFPRLDLTVPPITAEEVECLSPM